MKKRPPSQKGEWDGLKRANQTSLSYMSLQKGDILYKNVSKNTLIINIHKPIIQNNITVTLSYEYIPDETTLR